MNTDVNLYVERDALLRQLLEVDDISVIKKVQNALKRALSTVKQTASQTEGLPINEFLNPSNILSKIIYYLCLFVQK